jgi:hypothetical protein
VNLREHVNGTLRALTVICFVLALAVCALVDGSEVPLWAPAVALGVAVSEIAIVNLRFGRQRWAFSLTEAVVGGAMVYSTGPWLVGAVAGGLAVAQVVRRKPLQKLGYNVAQFALSTAAAVVVAQVIGSPYVGASVGMVVFWLLNFALVAVAVSLSSGRPLGTLVASTAPISLITTAGNTSIGLVAAFLAVQAPLGLLGLVVPVGLLWFSYDQEVRRGGEARLYRELALGQEQAVTRSTDVSAQVVLRTAARIFGADAEMLVRAGDGPVRWVGDDVGAARRDRVDADAFDQGWVLAALGGRGPVVGQEDGRPFCTLVLGSAEAPQAVLIARRPRGAAPFGRRDVGLAEVLARQAEQWLSVSDLTARFEIVSEQAAAATGASRALGDIGAATAPALSVLRDSAGRLSRLADAGGVDDIVDELHLVERAVASLLGAVALAAEPELLSSSSGERLPDQSPALGLPQRATTDWTTTGVMR